MSDATIGVVIGGFVVLVVFGVFYFIFRMLRKKKKNFQTIKVDLGLDGSCGGIFSNVSLKGVYNGREIVIWQETVSIGNDYDEDTSGQHTFTHIDIGVENPSDWKFKLAIDPVAILKKMKFVPKFVKQAAEKFRSKMKVQDIEVGHRRFDEEWIVSSNYEDKILSLLDMETCDRILEIGDKVLRKGNVSSRELVISLDDGVVSILIRNDIHDPEKVKRLVEILTTLACDVESISVER